MQATFPARSFHFTGGQPWVDLPSKCKALGVSHMLLDLAALGSCYPGAGVLARLPLPSDGTREPLPSGPPPAALRRYLGACPLAHAPLPSARYPGTSALLPAPTANIAFRLTLGGSLRLRPALASAHMRLQSDWGGATCSRL